VREIESLPIASPRFLVRTRKWDSLYQEPENRKFAECYKKGL